MNDPNATKEDVVQAVLEGKPCPSCGAEWTEPDKTDTKALIHDQAICVKYRAG